MVVTVVYTTGAARVTDSGGVVRLARRAICPVPNVPANVPMCAVQTYTTDDGRMVSHGQPTFYTAPFVTFVRSTMLLYVPTA